MTQEGCRFRDLVDPTRDRLRVNRANPGLSVSVAARSGPLIGCRR